MVQAREIGGLVTKSFEKIRIFAEFRPQRLERDLAAKVLIDCRVDLTDATGAEQPLNSVRTDDATHFGTPAG
jgi:hypothetical protein